MKKIQTTYYVGPCREHVDIFSTIWRSDWDTLAAERARTCDENEECWPPFAFLTTCSHAKPYHKSYIHVAIKSVLDDLDVQDSCDYIHLTNAGVVHESFPITNSMYSRYDWDDRYSDEATDKYYVDTLAARLRDWYELYGGHYRRVYVYLRPDDTTMRAVQQSGIPHVVIPLRDPVNPPCPYLIAPDPDDVLCTRRNIEGLSIIGKDL